MKTPKLKGPYVIAIIGRMPGAPVDELVEVIDGFKNLHYANIHNSGLDYQGIPMSLKEFNETDWDVHYNGE